MQGDMVIDINTNFSALEKGFYESLSKKYGELIPSTDLARELGYKTTSALRQSIHKKKLALNVFEIQNRKGKFAYARDVATWLAKLK